ncbi:hypothetical protein QE109_14370 [Fusibacter bizertensis]|jgi:hypothetical protein|uniref:Transposase n=1 Tax=Fusibacter bizertensis TaxID=1488331 RepID=A0ABT6NFX4_9FIRM|nr:hypothetical protein [Fusibacter bizertensis]MDH8679339.1 hypothetical protein [Fusibacter bizertensis]
MFGKEDNTYNELRDHSVKKWLEDMSAHEDVAVRGGVRLATDYISDLKKKIARLESENALKNEYMKKMRQKGRE